MRSDVSPNGENYGFIYQTHVEKNIFDFFFDKYVNILANGVGSIDYINASLKKNIRS